MSSLFQRLAARASDGGVGEGVVAATPRHRSRFAPAPAARAGAHPGDPVDEARAVVPAAPAAVPRDAAVAPTSRATARPDAASAPVDRSAADRPSRAAPGGSRDGGEPHAPDVGTTGVPASRIVGPAPATRSRSTPGTAAADGDAATAPDPPGDPGGRTRRGEPPLADRATAAADTVAGTAPAAPADDGGPTDDAAAAPRTPPRVQAAPARTAAEPASATAAGSSPTDRDGEDASPSVTIHIGRVDVRVPRPPHRTAPAAEGDAGPGGGRGATGLRAYLAGDRGPR